MGNNELIAKNYVDAVKSNSIEERILIKLPAMVDCPNWKKINIIGKINHKTQKMNMLYNGYLAKYEGGLYFVKLSVINVVKNYDKSFDKDYPIIKVTI